MYIQFRFICFRPPLLSCTLFKKKKRFYLFLERGEGGQKRGGEISIVASHLLPTRDQARCALTGNKTSNLLFVRRWSASWNRTGQG